MLRKEAHSAGGIWLLRKPRSSASVRQAQLMKFAKEDAERNVLNCVKEYSLSQIS